MQVIRIEERDGQQLRSVYDLEYQEGWLVFYPTGTRTEWLRCPANQVQYRVGGNNDRLLFLSATQLGSSTVYLELNSATRKEILSHPSWAERLREPLARHRGRWKAAIAVAVLCVVAFSLLISYRRVIFGNLAQFIPFRAEKAIADQIFNPKMNEKQIQALEQFKPVLDRLRFDPKDWPHGFTFHISSATEPNAYATLGGHIFINKGLINSLEKTEDLLGVVAHEMIHVQQRHVARSMVQAIGVYMTLSLFLGDVSGIAAVLVDQGAPLLNLQYSRQMEDEADRLAVDLMIRNQIDPIGLGRSLRVIQDEQLKLIRQSPGSEVLEKLSQIEILSSHPDIDARIESINNRAKANAADKVFESVPFDYSAWKAVIKDAY